MVLRRATPKDATAIGVLLAGLGYSLVPEELGAVLVIALERSDIAVLLAEDDGAVGLVVVSMRPQLHVGGIIATVDELVVAERARGSGVGKALLDEAVAIARRAGAKKIELTTGRARESYRRGFYVKNGFVEAESAVMRRTP